MIPRRQTITMPPLPDGMTGHELVDAGEAEPGDCMRACAASILELEAHEVPHFVSYRRCETTDPLLWWYALVGWHATIGIAVTFTEEAPPGWSIAEGDSPRGYAHCVVAYNGETVHDPHPDGGGLVATSGYYHLHATTPDTTALLERDPPPTTGARP